MYEVKEQLWCIVLAGGDGIRTTQFIRNWWGQNRPKQYSAFTGSRSMFQHTLDRVARLTSWERIVVVAGRKHQQMVWSQLDGRPVGMVLLQPRNAGAAPGVVLALTYILKRDPHAQVVICPSGHFIYEEDRFVSSVQHATAASVLLTGRPVLLGIKADRYEPGYGLIQPGRVLARIETSPIYEIRSLLEKPDQEGACRMQAAGALWNMMIVSASGQQVWDLGLNCIPKMMHRFSSLQATIDTTNELIVLDSIYKGIPVRHFDSHVLQPAPERLAVMEVRDVFWSDWEHPDRIVETLQKIEKQPACADALPFLYQG
ncbi:MAG TPA: sugar phosphate nucleotidyltransferase [Nitrospira sp.]|nr:sugar phosphate nucleotidyltransferase [Nitrospira sp.]